MADDLIAPDQLPDWVPGRLTVRSPDVGWDGAATVRGYRYADSDVEVPPMRDFMVVAYRRGTTAMRRRLDDRWSAETLGPGDVSLLTRAADSHWTWSAPIDVVHVYLTHEQLTATCRDMYDREVADVELHDTIKADDPAIHRVAMQIAHEAAHGAPGAELLVDALTQQLNVTILRRHANILSREPGSDTALSLRRERAVRDHVQGHLHHRITLDDLAGAAELSKFHFARQFKASLGTTPHEFVLRQRLERARMMIERTSTPLRDVAARCGFADQSHMNRLFRRRLGVTPGGLRAGR